MKKFAKMALAAAIAGLGLAANANVVIDDFLTEGQSVSDATIDATGDLSSSGFSSSILGGFRDIYVTRDGTLPNLDPTAEVKGKVLTAGGVFSYSSDDYANGWGFIRWDGANAGLPIDKVGLGHKDLSGASAFQVSAKTNDLGFPFSIDVYTDASNWASLTLYSLGTGVFNIDFADFIGVPAVLPSGAVRTGAGTVDFKDIGALQVTFNFDALTQKGFTSSLDFSIGTIGTVPEPESLALVGLGLLGLAATRRRKIAA